ncbi:MAG: alpha/beta fold hydrolase [Deltaproteobacteria bacterium]|nr:alpha/beta fold hydrolase [Deltaproteobacteria bacterium]
MRPARVAVVALGAVVAVALAWRVTPPRRASSHAMPSLYVGGGGAEAGASAPRARASAHGSADACGVRRHRPIGESFETPSGRTFHVWGPDDVEPSRAYPVVLAFHGWSSSGRGFQKWFEMEKQVGDGAFVVYPDSKGAQWDYAGTTDTDFVAAIVEQLAGAYCIDRARVLAIGFSYGARFVNHLGCTRPDVVRAIVAGGGAWDPETGCTPMSVLVVHRTNDPTMRIAGGREAAARWAKIDGCEETPVEIDAQHGCSAYRGCANGAVTFCEDRFVDASWPVGWNHTVREEYRTLAWSWFLEVP